MDKFQRIVILAARIYFPDKALNDLLMMIEDDDPYGMLDRLAEDMQRDMDEGGIEKEPESEQEVLTAAHWKAAFEKCTEMKK